MKIHRACWQRIAIASVALLMLPAAQSASAQSTFSVLTDFGGADGAGPYAGLVQGFDGNLYGTTEDGGGDNYGTLFRITPAGALDTLYSFCAKAGCADGSAPSAGLVQGADGDFYGTTTAGGLNDDGTIFKITSAGTLTRLHSFCSLPDCADGYFAAAALVQAGSGDFYGTTEYGGAHTYGTVFRITTTGALTTLYSFCAQAFPRCTDGAIPHGALIEGVDGDFYGTTTAGGAANYGTVFRINASGALTTLYSFCAATNCTDGAQPTDALVQGRDGNFYGTTAVGGANGDGTVFKITPAGVLTTLYSFCAQENCADGALPQSGLTQATDGNFYGTTAEGGLNQCSNFGGGCGTMFRMTSQGSLATLHSFDPSGGDQPVGRPFQATSGVLYGTAFAGGTSSSCTDDNGCGTVFSLAVGLRPFVETIPSSGDAGAAVKILGTDLTGATAVTFGGVPAAFKVISPTEISTTVPSGAATGTVQVITPRGALSSDVPFRVIP
jgi:uncharacterized repeat protein (TIGR03803 family)